MLGLTCNNLRDRVSTTRIDGRLIEVFRCKARGHCTLVDEGQAKGGELLPICQESDGRACHCFVEAQASGEPVGDCLREILKERGIDRPECASCISWRKRMNTWGIVGCNANRAEIIVYLRKQKTTWGEKWSMATGGIWTIEGLLNEAMDRAKSRAGGPPGHGS